MGYRSYLYLRKNNRNLYIFEANNSLPFFWIALINKTILKKYFQDWQKTLADQEARNQQKFEQFSEYNPNSITISEQALNINSSKNRIFLKKHFPETLPLFDDFITYIKTQFETDDKLEIDITQLSAFYNSLNNFYHVLENELNAIETDNPADINFLVTEDLIGQGTGFVMSDNKEFSSFPSYQKELKNRKTAVIVEEQKLNKKSLVIAVILFLLCPVFSIIAYKMYKDEGLTGMIALIGILNLGFYCFSIWSLKKELNTFLGKRT
ncbi:hypothetical protein AAW12_18935 [Sphingobacterium sp. Ag1]|uniref:hypothetical protein n=1 Tax=Sphingobacterium sp. Ag1 TaxID=1643451 RepID=UPI000627D40E|nr:hypothetical protein [Sphingobacterium sp. Ag1]KKO89682.1 hypothetical protein AAW12_18935 [Sphingobacterium sp. Ag1]